MNNPNKHSSFTSVIARNHEKILDNWINTIRNSSFELQSLQLISMEELSGQARNLLKLLSLVPDDANYSDLKGSEFDDLKDMLKEISMSRAKQGFNPSETTVFIFSIKESIIPFLLEAEQEKGEVLEQVIQLNKLIDILGLFAFEQYVSTREEIISQQSNSLLELSTPILKLWHGIVLLPLIGVVDTARASQSIERLLHAIVDTESSVAILDITGVPVIDTRVAQTLLKTVNAAKMLGAQTIITGISPEAAQTLIKLDIEIQSLYTASTMQRGLARAFEMLGKTVTDFSRKQL
ncbi:STAS domain-containing protein [Deltaproteobacteria bacterium TL4]